MKSRPWHISSLHGPTTSHIFLCTQHWHLPLYEKHICSLDILSQQFLRVRTVFLQKTWIIRFISQGVDPWNIYFFLFCLIWTARWLWLWLPQASKTKFPRTMRIMTAKAILTRFSTVWSYFSEAVDKKVTESSDGQNSLKKTKWPQDN